MKNIDWNIYLGKAIICECGKEHRCDIGSIIIKDDALDALPDLLKGMDCRRPCVVCDVNTQRIAGGRISDILVRAGYPVCSITFPDAQLVPDERAVGTILTRLEADCDLIVAVGSGTINDLCRFVSGRTGIKYIILATAPSMDGYASSVSPLIVDNVKTTFPSVVPMAIIGDTGILRAAPMEMIAAGVADVLGKYVCLADWKISRLVNGEYYCPYVAGLVEENLKSVVSGIEGVRNRESGAIAEVMQTLILSGMAIAYIGNSRPASGSEHHLAHYWETVRLQGGKHDILHGTNVGVATVVCLSIYKRLAELLPTLMERPLIPDVEAWTRGIERAYGPAAKGVIELERTTGKNSPEAVVKRVEAVLAHREEILAVINTLPEPKYVAGLLRMLDAPYSPAQVGADGEILRNSLYYAKDLRNRYGLLQLLYDFGLTEEMLEFVLGQS
ncbi:MAG: sn-glycerol-1-phosphate dehydrogenase [Eubacteriales bacterium]